MENEKLAKIEELARPLHAFITEQLPPGSFRTNQAWARLQECVNWATNAALEEEMVKKKAEQK